MLAGSRLSKADTDLFSNSCNSCSPAHESEQSYQSQACQETSTMLPNEFHIFEQWRSVFADHMIASMHEDSCLLTSCKKASLYVTVIAEGSLTALRPLQVRLHKWHCEICRTVHVDTNTGFPDHEHLGTNIPCHIPCTHTST